MYMPEAQESELLIKRLLAEHGVEELLKDIEEKDPEDEDAEELRR
jgi:hypothetical protein